jgi:hypothetical protein
MSLILQNETYTACVKDKIFEAKGYNNSYERYPQQIVGRSITTIENLHKIRAVAERVKDNRTIKAVDALMEVRKGEVPRLVPNYPSFVEVMTAFLESRFRRGWLYQKLSDDKIVAYLVTSVEYHEPKNNSSDDQIRCTMNLAYHGWEEPSYRGNDPRPGLRTFSVGFNPGDVTRRQPEKILEAEGFLVETAELEAQYDADIARFETEVDGRFGQQFHFNGTPLSITYRTSMESRRNEDQVIAGRVILDQEDLVGEEGTKVAEVKLFTDKTDDDMMQTPVHPICRVFDLRTHKTVYAHVVDIKPYVYKPHLADKLILPETHRDLLDVLTSDLDLLADDIIEGKAANNIILCRGVPGVGKTLTAEIYSEITGKPLYPINAGSLGIEPAEIEKNLDIIFKRARRWGCIILLDEADVFVMERGTDIRQNAVVAVFLRVLEYFNELMFLTTNRSDLIDDAILSRCLAVIDYKAPVDELARQGWKMMTTHFKLDLSDSRVDELATTFPKASLRDMKLLTRLTIKWARAKKSEVDLDIFKRASVFRGMEMKK